MLKKLFIPYVNYFLPKKNVSINELFAEVTNTEVASIEEFKNETQLDRISIFENNDDIVAQVMAMIEEMVETTGISLNAIHYVFVGNEALLEYKGGSIIHYVLDQLHMHHTTVVPLLQPCTASMLSLHMLQPLLTQTEGYGLVLTGNIWPVTANRWPHVTHRFVEFSAIGDGLGIILAGGKNGIIALEQSKSFLYGGASSEHYSETNTDNPLFNRRMNMIKIGCGFIEKTLDEWHIPKESIDKIITSNVRRDIYEDIFSMLLDVDSSVFYLNNVAHGGHITDVDLIRNLKDYLDTSQPDGTRPFLVYGVDLEPSFDINYYVQQFSVVRC